MLHGSGFDAMLQQARTPQEPVHIVTRVEQECREACRETRPAGNYSRLHGKVCARASDAGGSPVPAQLLSLFKKQNSIATTAKALTADLSNSTLIIRALRHI